MIKFELTDWQTEKVLKFQKKHSKCKYKHCDAIGCGSKYIFMPTSLGTVAMYQCSCGKTLDLTDSRKW